MRTRAETLLDGRGWWLGLLALGTAVAAGVWLGGARVAGTGLEHLAGGALVLGALAAAALVFGPPRWIFAVFIAAMVCGHQFRSPFVLPFGGVEWHPRELLLLLLFAHAAVRIVSGRADLRPEIMHYFLFLYASFFAFAAAWGIHSGHALSKVIAECRYPLFLGAYIAFAICGAPRETVCQCARLVLGLALLIALAGLAFWTWAMATQNIVNTQNVLGEFMQYPLGSRIIQTARPNGHMYYEIAVVVMTSLILSRHERLFRKALYAGLTLVFLAAIAVTLMRTAYVSLAVSLAALAVLCLPRRLHGAVLAIGLLAALAAGVVWGVRVYEAAQGAVSDVGISLKGRFTEIAGAWDAFVESPLLGTGLGSTFTAFGYVAKTSQLAFTQAEYQTLHNVWMYYLFKGGLVGMLLAGGGLAGMVWRAHAVTYASVQGWERAFCRGLLAALIGQLIASLAMPRLTYPVGGAYLAMTAAAFVLLAHPRPEAARAEPGPPPGRN